MNIAIEESSDTVLVSIEGSIEATSIRPLTDKIADMVNFDKNVQIDIAAVDYIDSSGIRAFLTLFRKLKDNDKSLKIINSNENIKRVLQLSSLQGVLNIS